MSDWMISLGLLSVTGGHGPYQLSPPDVAGAFDGPPVARWIMKLPTPPQASATHTERSGPLLHGERIYVGAAGTDGLLVLDRRDGSLLQRLPATAPVQSAAVISDEHIFFTDVSGTTWCYPLGSTRALWDHFSGAPLLSPPTIDGSSVYVANVDGEVYALSATDGELLWRYAHRTDPGRMAELELYGAPSPVLAGDVLLTGYSDGAMIALSASSGDPLWSRRVGEGAYPDLIAEPAVRADDYLIAGYIEPLVSMDRQTQAIRWRQDIGGAHPVVEGDGQLLHSGGDGILRALDEETGDLLWEWDSGTESALTRPLVTEAGILVGAAAGSVYLVDAVDGSKLWEYDPGYFLSGVTAVPAVDGRQAVVLTNAGNLISFVVPR
ncbi:MAG: outer membrane protein assembly factor BamB [Myxococcota bacterium]|jgi:outer membrane protein assembly factor BamB